MKRKSLNKKTADVEVSDVESEEEQETQEEEKEKPKKKGTKRVKPSATDSTEKEEKKGYNWSAIVIMLMFAIPMLITGVMHVRYRFLHRSISIYYNPVIHMNSFGRFSISCIQKQQN